MSCFDQLFANSLSLILFVDRQVRQVGAVVKIANRTGDAHQKSVFVSGGNDTARVFQHSSNAIHFIDWPTLCQC